MKGKILLVVGLGVGYVLGTRAGREKYDELVAKVQKVWNDPRVQKQANNVGEFVKDKAPDVADFVVTNVKKATTRTPTTATKPASRRSSTPRSTPSKS
ncbi:MAG TPA: YtxH domain-containing protein [Galbitalea sp.]|jgi:hypothetical protein|nr:YtxH domain-containing protein [Galbitalea sp.]